MGSGPVEQDNRHPGYSTPCRLPSVVLIVDRVRYPKRGDDHKSREPKGSEEIRTITSAPTVLTALQAQAYVRSLPKRKPTSFEKLFPDADAEGMGDISTGDNV